MTRSHKLILVFTTLMFLIAAEPGFSQSSPVNSGIDIVNRYVWRGINLGGASPHLQPYIEFSPGNSGLVIGTWGSYGTAASSGITEADLFISYSPVEAFSITVTDYFFPSDQPFSRDRYFNYKKGETGHTIEGMASFNGTENFPVSVLFAMNLYGDDGTDENGDNYFAKYLEIGYYTSLETIDIHAFAGMALDNPKTDQGAQGWYGDSGGLINIGVSLSGALKLSETFSLPTFSSLIFNPEAGNIFIVAGISLDLL